MVDVSVETPEQIERRLNRVIRLARMEIYEAPYTFNEFSLSDFPRNASQEALAFVRDDDGWSQLVPSNSPEDEAFMLVRFHFPEGVDNSGFVGWLASRFKHRFGSGVFVLCGQNSKDGGIYDYWGVPLSVADAIRGDLNELVHGE